MACRLCHYIEKIKIKGVKNIAKTLQWQAFPTTLDKFTVSSFLVFIFVGGGGLEYLSRKNGCAQIA